MQNAGLSLAGPERTSNLDGLRPIWKSEHRSEHPIVIAAPFDVLDRIIDLEFGAHLLERRAGVKDGIGHPQPLIEQPWPSGQQPFPAVLPGHAQHRLHRFRTDGPQRLGRDASAQ